jgi:hypothetical protein
MAQLGPAKGRLAGDHPQMPGGRYCAGRRPGELLGVAAGRHPRHPATAPMVKRYQLPAAEVQRWGEGQGGAAQPEQSEQPRCAAGAFWSGRRHAARSQRRRGEEGRPGRCGCPRTRDQSRTWARLSSRCTGLAHERAKDSQRVPGCHLFLARRRQLPSITRAELGLDRRGLADHHTVAPPLCPRQAVRADYLHRQTRHHLTL